MPNGTFQLGKIEQTSEGFFDKFYERFFTDIPGKGKLLSVYKFEIDRVSEDDETQKSHSYYKVKVFHMNDDEFRGVLYPLSIRAYMQYRWYNRKRFRIL